MKISLKCHACAKEKRSTFQKCEVRDDQVYQFTCAHGHNISIIIAAEKFEILFESALNSYVDGNYRDTVSSSAAALERFYQYYVEVFARHCHIPFKTFQDSWKLVSKQSERQLGAYILAYIRQTGRTPALLSNSNTAFRNEVTHKGQFPDPKDALEFATAVADLILPVLDEMNKEMADAIEELSVNKILNGHATSGVAANRVRYEYDWVLNSQWKRKVSVRDRLIELGATNI